MACSCSGRKRQQGLWHYDMQLQRRFEAVPGGKQLLLGHAAAAEVRGFRGANGRHWHWKEPAGRPVALWHAAAAEAWSLSGGQTAVLERRKGFVATTAGTGTGRNGSTACGTMACSCSGGSKPFRGADGRPGTVEKDLLRPRQALALEGSGGKACGTRACSCSRGFEAFAGSKRQSWNRRKECCNHGRHWHWKEAAARPVALGHARPFRGANGRRWHWKEPAGRPVALWHAAAAEVWSLSGGQTAVLEP